MTKTIGPFRFDLHRATQHFPQGQPLLSYRHRGRNFHALGYAFTFGLRR